MASFTYLAIDLKSFYASVECVERGLDPMTTNLVVADKSRTEKTICLAVSPSLKAYGIPGRARLFEVQQKVAAINRDRLQKAPGHRFTGASFHDPSVKLLPGLALDYVVAPPQMARYMTISAQIYQRYLHYVAPEDIHVYSIDEVFMDITRYLPLYGLTPRQLARRILLDVYQHTGITATAGIGTNLYLCKVAMDIGAKHILPDENGVRIAELDEDTYRRTLWTHRPLTDFWRVGRGYAKKLEENGLYTMGDIARCSVGRRRDYYNEDFLFRLFGVNAELLIDHAWGREPCTMADIKAYKPEHNSLGAGQVLSCPYPYEKARLVMREMADQLALDLVEKGLVTDQVVLTVGYDRENLSDPTRRRAYRGPITTDFYGRAVPRHAHGTRRLPEPTASSRKILQAFTELFQQVVHPALLVRRLNLTACHVITEADAARQPSFEQMSLFADETARQAREEKERAELLRERNRQQAVLSIKKKYGKNAILKGMNLQNGATAPERNGQIGGHKA